jgi:hypothetical protein
VKRFRGSVASSPIWKNTYTDAVCLSPSTIEFKPFLRRNVAVSRDDLAPIELAINRNPFLWRTELRFRRRVDNSLVRIFRPARYRRFLRALSDWNWPLDDSAATKTRPSSGDTHD